MDEECTAMTWNVAGEVGVSDARMQRQLDFLERHAGDVDLYLLQAVQYERVHDGTWGGQLGALLEYFRTRGFHVVHTGDWAEELANSAVQPHSSIEGAHNRCNLVASRWPIERQPLTLRNRGDRKPRQLDYYYSHFPEKMLVARVDIPDSDPPAAHEVAVWNVGIINGANWGEEKLNMLETVYGRVYLETTKTDTPLLLGGDFNAPKRETADRTIVPHGHNTSRYTNYPFYGEPHHLREGDELTEYRFDQRWRLAEARLFDPNVGEWTMRDAYWTAATSEHESSTVDYTYELPTGSPKRKRLDHLLVSRQFDVQHCEIWNGERTSIDGFAASDLAPVVATCTVR